MRFAIRGAGQQPLEACSNIDEGITLDLGLLDRIQVRPDDSIVYVGAGARWTAIHEKVEAAGLGVGGRRSSRGGVGWLAISCGLSFSSTRKGFINNSVINFQVVLASGEITNENAQQKPDL